MTNIRDVLEDAKIGRRYLPANWVDLTPTQLASAETEYKQLTSQAIKQLLKLADEYYQSALLGIQPYPLLAFRHYRRAGISTNWRTITTTKFGLVGGTSGCPHSGKNYLKPCKPY